MPSDHGLAERYEREMAVLRASNEELRATVEVVRDVAETVLAELGCWIANGPHAEWPYNPMDVPIYSKPYNTLANLPASVAAYRAQRERERAEGIRLAAAVMRLLDYYCDGCEVTNCGEQHSLECHTVPEIRLALEPFADREAERARKALGGGDD